MMAVMGLGVKCGDTVTVKVEGGAEAAKTNLLMISSKSKTPDIRPSS